MNPEIWGAKMWFILHIITFSYPENPTFLDKRHYNDFFTNLQYVIPCDKCKLHYREHLENNPLTPNLDKKEDFVNWLIQVHNSVNVSKGKQTMSYNAVLNEYKEILEKYDKDYSIPDKKNTLFSNIFSKLIKLVGMATILIGMIYLLKYIYSKKNSKTLYLGIRR
jgi:hypothetical protein